MAALEISVLVMPFLLNLTTLFALIEVAGGTAVATTAVTLKSCRFGSLNIQIADRLNPFSLPSRELMIKNNSQYLQSHRLAV